ncbi:hypothetical protein KP3161_27655 (plasmid) [Klebsiella pneumoniae]|nr:hypothetical protein KP3161_27655 [Klebsiella pneumoniae]CAK6617439.1 hypothetical protein KP4482023_27495 [Klebsiella pneumoniae]SLR64405.1 Uncharacterised protein [Klebsiella pneumoniae]SWN88825.1 Uncharacterised protein [Klebsiella pneumoniae]SXA94824.1 Uncharacterised protein [Klebsiella pneumoniae]
MQATNMQMILCNQDRANKTQLGFLNQDQITT